MRTSNIPTGSQRVMETGAVWIEVISGGSGTIDLFHQQTFRVRAAGAVTVTIGGILAMTMAADEIVIFNAGHGEPENQRKKVEVEITGNAFVQVAREKETEARRRI